MAQCCSLNSSILTHPLSVHQTFQKENLEIIEFALTSIITISNLMLDPSTSAGLII